MNATIKKKRKNITLGIVHIKATFNNTIVTITDVQGNCIASSSAGAQDGIKGTKKATPFAAQLTVDKSSQAAIEHGMKTVSIRISGPGIQRESAMRAVMQHFIVTHILDKTSVKHGGNKEKKARRV